LPLFGVAVLDEEAVQQTKIVNRRGAALLKRRKEEIDQLKRDGVLPAAIGEGKLLLGVVGLERVLRVFERLFHEDRFLSPYGLRAISRSHLAEPFSLEIEGSLNTIGYEPAESTTGMFGGNSNWRGSIWMPVNYLV